jgi:hypothetical protein
MIMATTDTVSVSIDAPTSPAAPAQRRRRDAIVGLRPVLSPSLSNRTYDSPHPALHEHTEWFVCPVVQLAPEVKYPPPCAAISTPGNGAPYSPATSLQPTMPRTHWTSSPHGRLSGPPWWVVIPMTTTGPPPRPGGNSGRCAAPTLAGSAGTAGALPTLTHTPFGSVAAQLLPRGLRRALPQPSPRTRPPDQKRAGETAPSENNDRASQQPIAASFRAGDEHRGFHHWYRFPCALLPANGPGPLAADRFLHRRGPLAARRRTSGRSCPPTSPHSYGGRGLSPGHMAPHGAVPLASEAVGKRAA